MARGKFVDNKNEEKDNPRNRKLFGGPSNGVKFGMHRAVMQNEPEPALPEPMQAQIEEVPQMQLAVLEEVQEAAEVHERELRMQTEDHRLEEWLHTMEASKTRRHRSISGFFKKKNSEQYTAVMNSIKSVLVHTKVPFKDDSRTNLDRVKNVSNAYFKLIDACEVYLNKDGGQSASGRARKNMVQEVLNLAKEDITAVQQCYADIYTRKISEEDQAKLNWKDIIYSAREATIEVDDLHDDKVFKPLGAQMKSGDNASRMLKGGVFTKEVKQRTDGTGDEVPSINYEAAWSDRYNHKGDYGKETSITNRNVATSRMAALLGVGNIVEESKTVNVKDNKTGNVYKGNLMSFAKGDAAESETQKMKTIAKKKDSIEERFQSVQKMIDPSMQKELCSLQVLDFICGQGDRHRGNYFIEKNGKDHYSHVHGIDNDMSFSTGVDYGKFVDETHSLRMKMRVVVDSEGKLSIPYMDKQLAINILRLEEDTVRFCLQDLLEPQYINNTIERIKLVQKAIETEGLDSPRFRQDNEWNEDTARAMMQKTADWKKIEKAKEAGRKYENASDYNTNNQELVRKFNGLAFSDDTSMWNESSYFGEFLMEAMGFHKDGNKFWEE